MVQKFPAQLREAMEIGKKAQIDPLDNPVHQIFVAGMGGSGIGADFVASFIRDECRVPYLVAKTYDAPAYVNEHTLAIASSYSGNTEETISCIQQVKENMLELFASPLEEKSSNGRKKITIILSNCQTIGLRRELVWVILL